VCTALLFAAGALFSAYDADGSGSVDMSEFQRVADSLGFGAAAHELFLMFDDEYAALALCERARLDAAML
jgi:hypothetical protein